MSRPPSAPVPTTPLGVALIARRDGRSGRDAAAEIGIDQGVLSRLERGERDPSIQTTLKLARWLGWTAEQVIEGARVPVATEE